MKKYLLIFGPLFICLEIMAQQVVTVTNTNDSGSGSLRNAIETAISFGSETEIKFNISGDPPYIIQLATEFELGILEDIKIIGNSQPGWELGAIVIDGENIPFEGVGFPAARNGFYIGNNAELIGLKIINFTGSGIRANGNCQISQNIIVYCGTEYGGQVQLSDNVLFLNNYVGYDPSLDVFNENGWAGFGINGALSVYNNCIVDSCYLFAPLNGGNALQFNGAESIESSIVKNSVVNGNIQFLSSSNSLENNQLLNSEIILQLGVHGLNNNSWRRNTFDCNNNFDCINCNLWAPTQPVVNTFNEFSISGESEPNSLIDLYTTVSDCEYLSCSPMIFVDSTFSNALGFWEFSGNFDLTLNYSAMATSLDNSSSAFSNCNLNCSKISDDYDPLMALYTSTDGENWTNNSGWADGAAGLSCDPCTDGWYGVTCENGRVTCIDLDGTEGCNISFTSNNLNGTIPSEIGNLDSLKNLNLRSNNINGLIPLEIGALSNLDSLNLYNNNLTGPIPQELTNLQNLKFISLGKNDWNQEFPVQLFECPLLEDIAITFGGLTGPLPEIPNPSQISSLTLNDNDFEGCYPSNYIEITGSVLLKRNSRLPWEGDISFYILTSGMEQDQHGAPCNLLDGLYYNYEIDTNCSCRPAIGCINLNLDFNDICDDGNPSSTNDVINSNCECYGETISYFDPSCSAIIQSDFFGSSGYDAVNDIHYHHDNSVLFCGSVSNGDIDVSNWNGGLDGWLVKLDENNNILWESTIAANNADDLRAIEILGNGNIVAAGYATNGLFGKFGYWLMFDQEGDQISDTPILLTESLTEVIEVDKELYFLGENGYIGKFDIFGNSMWQDTFSSDNQSVFNGIINLDNNTVVAVGETVDSELLPLHGMTDGLILNIDSEGQILTSKNYGGSSNDCIIQIIKHSNGDFYTVGYTESSDIDITSNYGNSDIWLMRLDGNFDIVWSKTLGGSGRDMPSLSLIETEKGILFSSTTNSIDQDLASSFISEDDIWLVLIDEEGNILSNLSYGSSSDDGVMVLEKKNDNSIIIGGYSLGNDNNAVNNPNYGDRDIWILELETIKLGNVCQYPINAETDLGDPNLYYLECGEEYILNPVDGLCEDLNATCSNGTTWYYFQVDQDIPEFSISGGVFELFEGPINNLGNGIEHDCTGLVSLGCDEGNFYTDPTKGYFLLIELGPVTVSGSKEDELVNDDCPSAIFLQEGSGNYFGDNSCATGDVNTCHVGTDGDGHVIYYLYSTGDAPEDITITINSQGNGSMTQGSISVFDDCLGTTTLTQIWDQQNGTGQLCSALDDANGVQLSCVPANTFMNIAIGSDGRPWQTNGPGPTLPGRFVLNLDVTLSEPLPLVTGGPTEICNDSSAELSVSLEDGSMVGTLIVTPAANSNIAGATDYAFENGAGFISDILINNTSVAQTQIYDAYLDISDSNCPVSLSQLEVTVYPELEVSFQSNEIIIPFSIASSFELIPEVIGGFGSNYQYSWSDGSTGPTIDLQNPVDNQLALVCVTITDDLGCESEDCAELVYEEPTCRYRDSLALVALYNSTNGADWFNTWDLDQPITTWFGISISEEGCVTCIDMDGDPDCISDDIGPGGNNLTGILTDSLAQLSQLEYLILQNNSIGGNLLDWQGLNNLILYNIQYSKLSDTIPDFSGMPNLERLVLSNNNLEGEIPNFSGMPKLMRLFITDNNLEGEIPNFSNIPLLDNFSFKSNQLSGPIPDFQFCPELTGFNVWYNNLTGPVPNFQLPKATQLFIGWNALDGEVPDFDGMPLLFELQMQIGNLTGNIPTFENCPNLQIANFRVNNLSGCYPIQLLDNLCNKSYNFTENTLLPWEGDMTSFCNGDNQIGAQCNDGDANTLTEEIDEDCVCREVCPTLNAGESFPSTHCEGDPPIDFFAQMFNFDSGGVWEDPISTGVNLSNPLLVDISGLSADTYEFYYIIGDTEGCPRDTNRVIVVINENSESEVTLESCTGEPIVVNGQSYMESTEVDVLDQNVLGCDSIIHYEISIYQNFEEPYQAIGCDGDIVEINGQNYTFIGGQDLEIQQLLTSVEYPACDSILNITLIGVADQETDLIQTLCNDDMLQVGPDIYDLGNPSGTTTLFGEASNGCDSIVQVDIAFLPMFSATKTAEICFGESYSFNGVEYMQSGIYQDTIVGVAQLGCDSLYMLDLEFLPQSIETFNSVACIGDVELIGSEMILVNKGSILDTTFTYPKMSQFGCDSILRVIIDPLPLGESEITGYLCGSQEVVIENDTFDLDRLSDVVISEFSAYNGCDSLLYVAFEYLDEVVAEDDFFSSNTRFFTLDPLGNDGYDQSSDITIELNSNPKVDSISFENMDEIEVVLLIGVTDTVSFDYILCDELCGVCDTANIVLLKSDSGFVDDVVTCNNDGTNDSFILSEVKENLADDFPCNKINIFNRWGQPVYTASPYDNDWCGTFMDTGRTLPEGTYYFELDLFGDRACDESTFNLGATSLFYGSITVLR